LIYINSINLKNRYNKFNKLYVYILISIIEKRLFKKTQSKLREDEGEECA
jgi:hypothetical protein